MKLKVIIEKNGTPFTSETIAVTKDLAPFFVVGLVQNALVASELMHKDDRLEILGSDEDALLSKSGH